MAEIERNGRNKQGMEKNRNEVTEIGKTKGKYEKNDRSMNELQKLGVDMHKDNSILDVVY